MVRGYNPGETDPVKYLFDSAFRLFKRSETLSPETTMKLVQSWFASVRYDPIFQLFRSRNLPSPKVKLLSNCSERYFPAEWQSSTNTIGLCMKHIHNKIELKENIDRELVWAYS